MQSGHFDKYFVKKHKKKSKEKLGVFCPRYYTLNRKFNSKIAKIRAFFFKIKVLFSIFKNGEKRPHAPPTHPPTLPKSIRQIFSIQYQTISMSLLENMISAKNKEI